MNGQMCVSKSSLREDLGGQKHIYCISGLGADEKVFSKFQFPLYEIHFIKWITPAKNESIQDYAKHLIQQIDHDNPTLIGLSFGGIMCIEIAQQIKTDLIIIISSIKSPDEMPRWMWLSGKLKLNKLFPMRSFKITEPLQNYNLGVKTKEEKTMVKAYRKNVDPLYSDWAINAVLNWKCNIKLKNLFHIHGDRDRIFSIKNIKPDYIINDGGHFMIMNKSEEVNSCINSILKNRI